MTYENVQLRLSLPRYMRLFNLRCAYLWMCAYFAKVITSIKVYDALKPAMDSSVELL